MTRCLRRRPAPFYRLLRFFEAGSDREVLRVSQHQSGHTAVISSPYPGPLAMPSLAELPGVLERLGWQAGDIVDEQYIASEGFPWRCTPEEPCIAFRSAKSIFILSRGDRAGKTFLLYEVPPDAHRVTVSAHRDRSRTQGLAALGVTDVEEPLVTLGFGLARARLVAGKPPDR